MKKEIFARFYQAVWYLTSIKDKEPFTSDNKYKEAVKTVNILLDNLIPQTSDFDYITTDEGREFCPECGCDVVVDDTKICPNCGKILTWDQTLINEYRSLSCFLYRLNFKDEHRIIDESSDFDTDYYFDCPYCDGVITVHVDNEGKRHAKCDRCRFEYCDDQETAKMID